MEFLKFDINKCVLCGVCVEKCPFGALTIEGNGIVVGDACRMCGLCVRNCPEKAIRFEQKAKSFDKDKWKNFLIYVEQERGEIHPVTFELIGEARKMAVKVGYQVNCVIVGGKGTKENAEKLLPYGVDNVYVYEHEGFEGFRADCYTDAVADCIAANKPSSVLIGATAAGAFPCAEAFHQIPYGTDCRLHNSGYPFQHRYDPDQTGFRRKYHGSDWNHQIHGHSLPRSVIRLWTRQKK